MTTFTLDGLPPHQRDPRKAPWGLYLAWSMGAGGEQGFHWFPTEQEALAYLYELDDTLFPFDPPGVEEGPGTTLERMSGGTGRLRELPLLAINHAQTLLLIRWVGHFEDLLRESSRFAREIRRDFRDFLDEGIAPDMQDPALLDQFVQHLGNYIRRFPERSYCSPYTLNRPQGDA